MVTAMSNQDGDVRAFALDTVHWIASTKLHRKQKPDLVVLYVHALKDSSPKVRNNAACYLSGYNDKRALDALQDVLYDKNPRIRYWALDGLQNIGSPEPVFDCIVLLGDNGITHMGSISNKALEVLRHLTKKDFGKDEDAWMAWYKANFQEDQ
jgi:hypothetical protein